MGNIKDRSIHQRLPEINQLQGNTKNLDRIFITEIYPKFSITSTTFDAKPQIKNISHEQSKTDHFNTSDGCQIKSHLMKSNQITMVSSEHNSNINSRNFIMTKIEKQSKADDSLKDQITSTKDISTNQMIISSLTFGK